MRSQDDDLTTGEFSELTTISVSTITKLLRRNKLRGEKRSGKWMIPKSELQSEYVKSKNEGSATVQSVNTTPRATPAANAEARSYTVSEFSKMTYLTESGVITFLKTGKLLGFKDDDGNWHVDAASLQLPHMRHLIRN